MKYLLLPLLALPLLAGGCMMTPERQMPPPEPAPSVAPTDRAETSDPDETVLDVEYSGQLKAEDEEYAKEEAALLQAEADAEAQLQ